MAARYFFLVFLFCAALIAPISVWADDDGDDDLPPANVTVEGSPAPHDIMDDRSRVERDADADDDEGDKTQSCDFQDFIGRTADEIKSSARFSGWTVRVLKPDTAVTQEYRDGRVNLSVNAEDIVTEIACW